MEWETYLEVNLLGSGYCSRGAILDADGSVLSTSSNLTITPAEGRKIVSGLGFPNQFQSEGCTVGGVKYFSIKAEPGLFYGKKGATGVCLAKSSRLIAIGIYSEGTNPAQCNMTVEALTDYLVSIGY